MRSSSSHLAVDEPAPRHGVGEARWEDDTDRAGPEGEKCVEDELVVFLGCKRKRGVGDGGSDSGIASLGPPLRRPSMMAGRVRPGTPQKWMCPSLFQVFGLPTRQMVLRIAAS
jgi:hypothetical protein